MNNNNNNDCSKMITSSNSCDNNKDSLSQQQQQQIQLKMKNSSISNNRTRSGSSSSSLHSPTSSIVHDLDLVVDGTSSNSVAKDTTKSTNNKKCVSFAPTIQIRTHEMILGDYPKCVGGMALECGWGHTTDEIINLNIHEENSTKRRMQQLHMGYSDRRKRLQAATGLSNGQLLQAECNLRTRRNQILQK